MVFDIYTLVEAIWLILPAFAANGLVPLIGRLVKTHPIDGGRKLVKNEIFGRGKSWEGLVFGSVVGALIGLIQWYAYPFLPWGMSPVTLTLVPMSAYLGFLLGLGAMVGDLGGSFIKRRFKMKRGKPAPLLDQEDFLIGALLFGALMTPILEGWIILLVVITPIIHWIANLIAYFSGLKKEPW